MKKITPILLICALILTGCAIPENKPDIVDTTTNEIVDTPAYITEPSDTSNEEKPATGFPSGQLQKEYIFYGGVVWTFDMYNTAGQKLKELPEDFTLVGQTLYEDPYVMPSEDLHTAHVETGRNVYITPSGDAIYIEIKKGTYSRFIPEERIDTLTPETTNPETTPPETTEPEPDNSIVYTAEYYYGSYNGYDFIDYEDENRGEAYQKAYPNKYFNDNVTIELEITAELEKTEFMRGEEFWISFKATNIGEPFMFIDYWAGYFDSRLVSTEHIANDGSDYIFHNDYYTDGRALPDAGPFEDLFETRETRVDANPYTVTEHIPTGKYDLYIYFGGYTFVVRDALEIVESEAPITEPPAILHFENIDEYADLINSVNLSEEDFEKFIDKHSYNMNGIDDKNDVTAIESIMDIMPFPVLSSSIARESGFYLYPDSQALHASYLTHDRVRYNFVLNDVEEGVTEQSIDTSKFVLIDKSGTADSDITNLYYCKGSDDDNAENKAYYIAQVGNTYVSIFIFNYDISEGSSPDVEDVIFSVKFQNIKDLLSDLE